MYNELEKKLGFFFQRKELLSTALTHSSYCNEHQLAKTDCNERLEFLGDAVLELASSRYLFEKYPSEQEGTLSKMRAARVCEEALAGCARTLELGKYLRMGKGEHQTGGAERDSILADALEAVLGAVYLDAGFEKAESIVRNFIMPSAEQGPQHADSKTLLQELVQSHGVSEIRYVLKEEQGPEHLKEFTMEVFLDGESYGCGTGHSKKQAEKAAAEAALDRLKKQR